MLKTPLAGRFLLGAGIAIVGVALMIVHEYRAAALGQAAVVAGTALTLTGVLCASTANIMQGTAFARAQSMIVMIAWSMLFGTPGDALFEWITTGPPVIETRFSYRSEEHTSELQSLMRISYAVFCLKKKNHTQTKKQ